MRCKADVGLAERRLIPSRGPPTDGVPLWNPTPREVYEKAGAGEGNRTLVFSLEG